MNRSRNGSGGGSDRGSGPDLRREFHREIRRVSGCCSRVEFHRDSEVDMREGLQNLCRGDSKGLLPSDSRFDLQGDFYRGLHGDSYRDLRGESRRGMPGTALALLRASRDGLAARFARQNLAYSVFSIFVVLPEPQPLTLDPSSLVKYAPAARDDTSFEPGRRDMSLRPSWEKRE